MHAGVLYAYTIATARILMKQLQQHTNIVKINSANVLKAVHKWIPNGQMLTRQMPTEQMLTNKVGEWTNGHQ